MVKSRTPRDERKLYKSAAAAVRIPAHNFGLITFNREEIPM